VKFLFHSTLGQEPVTIRARATAPSAAALHSPPDDGDISIEAVIDEHGQDVTDLLGDDDVERIHLVGVEYLNESSGAGAWA
jgi:hypothetical protein